MPGPAPVQENHWPAPLVGVRTGGLAGPGLNQQDMHASLPLCCVFQSNVDMTAQQKGAGMGGAAACWAASSLHWHHLGCLALRGVLVLNQCHSMQRKHYTCSMYATRLRGAASSSLHESHSPRLVGGFASCVSSAWDMVAMMQPQYHQAGLQS
jgi:hypothetical protein